MTDKKWGGRRDGSGSGGKRDGAGRPREKWDTGGVGTVLFMDYHKTPGSLPEKTRQWRIIEIEKYWITFQDVETEETYTLKRHYED